jgi:hypothetical protein
MFDIPAHAPKPLPRLWTILGVRQVQGIRLSPALFTAEDIPRIQALFPEADVRIWKPRAWRSVQAMKQGEHVATH